MRTMPPTAVRMYLAGGEFELWEDPDRPFGCSKTDLRGYIERGEWVLVFNAVTLAVGSPAAKPSS